MTPIVSNKKVGFFTTNLLLYNYQLFLFQKIVYN